MLYEDIRQGCDLYHENEDGRSYDRAYRDYLNDRDPARWNSPSSLEFRDADRLIYFCNQWKCHMPSQSVNVINVLDGLKKAVPALNLLRKDTLLDVEFNEIICDGLSVSQLIAKSFNGIALSGRRDESVATSKMLNAAVNRNLFVMWDGTIRGNYNVGRDGYEYAHIFLPQMQELARQAVNEAMQAESLSRSEAIKSFTERCENKNSLAKIIDEYNFAKFTLRAFTS